MTSVELRAYRWTRRRPSISVDGDDLVLRLPSYFGRHVWRVPAGDVVVADPSDFDDDTEVVFDPPLAIPYLFTTGPATKPTAVLLFRGPQRVPPVRLVTAIAPNADLPFGYWQARSDGGAFIDGVLVRTAVDDGAASLSALGIERVTRPLDWLRAHRVTVQAPHLIDEAKRLHRRARAKMLGSLTLFVLLAVPGRILVGDDPSWPSDGLLLAGVTVAVWLNVSARRDVRRPLRRRE